MSLWLKEKKIERPIYKPSICNVFLLVFVCRYVSCIHSRKDKCVFRMFKLLWVEVNK